MLGQHKMQTVYNENINYVSEIAQEKKKSTAYKGLMKRTKSRLFQIMDSIFIVIWCQAYRRCDILLQSLKIF